MLTQRHAKRAAGVRLCPQNGCLQITPVGLVVPSVAAGATGGGAGGSFTGDGAGICRGGDGTSRGAARVGAGLVRPGAAPAVSAASAAGGLCGGFADWSIVGVGTRCIGVCSAGACGVGAAEL